MKCLYLVTRSLDPTGTGQARWAMQVETSPQRVRHHLRRPDAEPPENDDHGNRTYTVHPSGRLMDVRRARSTLFVAFVATVRFAARRTS